MSIIHRIPSVPLLLLSLIWSIWLVPARADALTGTPQNDPKDLLPYCPTATPTPPCPSAGDISFLPMPSWARGVLLPPLPDALKPMGKPPKVATAPKPAPQPLQPPTDETTTAGSNAPASGTAAKSPETPAMITVSPFLQWVQSNPQAAANEARQQANVYRPPVALPGANVVPGANGAGASPYWLPPLIDTPQVDSSSSTPSGPSAITGSAAIYSTPQR